MAFIDENRVDFGFEPICGTLQVASGGLAAPDVEYRAILGGGPAEGRRGQPGGMANHLTAILDRARALKARQDEDRSGD